MYASMILSFSIERARPFPSLISPSVKVYPPFFPRKRQQFFFSIHAPRWLQIKLFLESYNNSLSRNSCNRQQRGLESKDALTHARSENEKKRQTRNINHLYIRNIPRDEISSNLERGTKRVSLKFDYTPYTPSCRGSTNKHGATILFSATLPIRLLLPP